jgi:hypothetical protein
MKAAPLLGYHVLLGVLGVSLLIAYGLMRLYRDWGNRRGAIVAIVFAWGFVLYGALARPAMLDHLAAQVGLGEGQYPDPLRALAARLGVQVQRPGGSAAFPLELPGRRETEVGLASEGADWLPPLSKVAPPPHAWTPQGGAHVTPDPAGVVVVGDTSMSEYQLMSPPVAVPPRATVTARVRVRVSQGRVCVGVLDASQAHWVLPATDVRQEHTFDTGLNDRVWFVAANCNRRITENQPSMFTLYGLTYQVTP